MLYQCPTEFNVPTSLLDCEGYNKRMQESTDPYKYMMDLKPGPMCMMTGRPFQGLMMAQRRPPPNLLGVENYLRSAPIFEQDRDYVIDDIHKAKPPRMPKPLSNKIVLPECKELPGYQRTKIRKTEFPDWSLRMERNGKKFAEYARPGRDTRAEIREAWKKKEQKDIASSDIYGVSKYDKRALTPATNPDCLSELSCMHVYGPNTVRTGKMIDPSKSVADLTSTGDGGLNVVPASEWNSIGVSNTSTGPMFTSMPGTPSSAMQNKTGINPDIPWTHQLADQQKRAGCNVRFLNYNPTHCN